MIIFGGISHYIAHFVYVKVLHYRGANYNQTRFITENEFRSFLFYDRFKKVISNSL